MGSGQDRCIEANHLRVHYNHDHDIYSILEAYALDIYGSRRILKGDVVLDLGAGIGEFALQASECTGPKGLVIAVEPGPEDYETMLRNIRENGVQNIVPMRYAIGEEEKVISLRFKGRTFDAKCKPLAALMKEAGETSSHSLDRIDFMKLDIEGAEAPVLGSMRSELQKVRLVAIELHGTKDAVDRVMDPLGFTFSPITRGTYLPRAAAFALRHPVQAHRMLAAFRRTGRFPGLSKVVGGIAIVQGEQLLVGSYTRRRDPRKG